MIQNSERGRHHADNIIDRLLAFNTSSTWSVVGTGAATITAEDYFQGKSCLKLNNTAYLTTDLTATNTSQSTLIPFDGIYDFSLYLKKSVAENIVMDIQIWKGGAQIYGVDINPKQTTTFSEDNVDNWTSFITNENFNLTKGDVITFRFKINSDATSLINDVSVFVDGMHFFNKERNQLEAPIFSESIYTPSDDGSGWGFYKDGQYTDANTFDVTDNDTYVALPNNKATVIEDQLPTGITTYYDGTKITPENIFDYHCFTIRFKAKNTVANGYGAVAIDIGGTFNEIFAEVLQFPRGANTEHDFSFPMTGYSGSTFVANGGIPKVKSGNGTISFYDIEIQVARLHKAR